ncbi:MAG: LPS export ABC transporter periplasmic protein LptC [Gammaproteobacteria bacterium]|nr:LPS export ABC transporter periplasmic protein LptC [Gammaproteobacteria bacterium]
MGKLRFLIIALLILGITLFTSWLLSNLGETPLVKSDKTSREPDYFFEGFDATARDKLGNINYRLEAQQLEHFPYNYSMRLEKPYIEVFNKLERPWQTWAEKGTFYENRRLMTLTGKVRIHRAANNGDKAITLLTDSITMDMKRKIAKTSADVEITSGEDVLNATGMKIDLKTGHIELQSKVKGKYDLPNTK